MRFFRQVYRIFFVCCVGSIISSLLPISIPGSVIALALLFILLVTKTLRVDQVNIVGDFLLKNMTFVFLPATISIVKYISVFQSFWWKFIIICLATTIITFLATAYSVKLTVFIMNKLKGGKKNVQ